MANNKGVTVKILGKDYQIACNDDQTHYLLEAAMMLDGRMKEIRSSGRVIGVERIAVMAALNLSYELLKLKEEMKLDANAAEKRLLQLHEKLENALTS